MAGRNFRVTLISAENLQKAREVSKMEVQARVSIIDGGGTEGEKRTHTDTDGETNPAWDFPMSFTVGELVEENHNAMLVVKLYCTRKLEDRYIGEVRTSMKKLFDSSRDTAGRAEVSFPVHKGGVVSQGTLRFLYRFGEREMIDKLLKAETSTSTSTSTSTAGGSKKEFPWLPVVALTVSLASGNFDISEHVSEVCDYFKEL